MHKVEKILICICFLAMLVLLTIDGFCNEVVKRSFPIIQKFGVYFMLWFAFLGMGYSAKVKQGHKFVNLATAILFLISGFLTFSFINESRVTGAVNPTTGIPFWILQIIMPISFFTIAVRSGLRFLRGNPS